jgi:ZIP family zinc transporter
MNPILLAFAITLFAGLSTGIGSLIALIAKKSNATFLSSSLGFSAGVMLYVSFMELVPTALTDLKKHNTPFYADLYLMLAFFGGILFIALIDYLVPSEDNPHEVKKIEDSSNITTKRLKRIGLVTAFSIAIHNFPEGMATFSAALMNPQIGISIAVAIAIHNIPEGIAVSVPIYQSTGSKKKAFWYSFLSGLSEPAGALIGYLFLMQIWTPNVNAIMLAATSGIMIFISLDELLPTARAYGKHHHAIIGLVLGMFTMALSLLLLNN